MTLIPPERTAELREPADQQRAWVDSAPDGQRDLDQSAFKGRELTGADGFWLATNALASPEGDLGAAKVRVRDGAHDDIFLVPSLLHMEEANHGRAQLEGAELGFAQLEGKFQRGAQFDGKMALASAVIFESKDNRPLRARLFQRRRFGPTLGDLHRLYTLSPQATRGAPT